MDRVIFAQDESLWTVTAKGEDKTRLLGLPWAAKEVDAISVASDGSALILRANGYIGWAKIEPGHESKLRLLPCGGIAQISMDGVHVVCSTQDQQRTVIYQLGSELGAEIFEHKPTGPLFFGKEAGELITTDSEKKRLIALTQDKQRSVADFIPGRSMAITPNGARAIGGFREGEIDVVYGFRLDGKAARRTLVHAARVVGVSADSAWAAIQQEIDACAVRIAGGQYMCWRRFEALAVSSQGRSLLLSRAGDGGHDLFLGTVAGTSSRKPSPVISSVERAAALWPSAPSP